jgi:hypothetical protein
MSELEQKVQVMENLNNVTRYEMSKSGFIIGFRVWTLKAYDGNTLICEVSKKRDNNYLKYVDLINKLIEKGYKLTETQRNEMKSSDFMNRGWLPYASKNDFINIGKLAGFTEQDYITVKNNKPENIQKLFAERLGLEYSELVESFNKF